MNQDIRNEETQSGLPIMDMSPDVAALCSSVEHDLLSVDSQYARTQDLRSALTDKLFASVITMDLDFKEHTDAEAFEAKMSAVNALRGLLTDQEKSAATKVSLKMKKRDQETNQQIGVNVVQLIEELQSLGTAPQFKNMFQATEQNRDELVDKLYTSSGLEIIKEELLETSDVTSLAEEVTESLMASAESDL